MYIHVNNSLNLYVQFLRDFLIKSSKIKFDEIYIAPKNNQEFINSILSLNPSIKVLKAE